MKTLNWHSIKQNALQFLIVQLFITLISLPIIVAWGLPLSLLSPLGNLIFSPFLTLFLLLASIIFFTQILCIPNDMFIWLLEYLTYFWKYLLTFSSQSALYAFKKPSFFILITIPVITLILVHHPRMRTPHSKLAGLIGMSLLTWSVLSVCITSQNWTHTIACNNGFISLIHHNNKTIVIDPGVIGQRISAPSWVNYTLIPEITKLTGSLTIDTLICTKIGKLQFDALQVLASKMSIKTIYLPAFKGELTDSVKKSFNRFYAIARAHNSTIKRSHSAPTSITNGECTISITPEQKQTYHAVEYTIPTIRASIDNTPVPIYSPKKNNAQGG